MIIDGIRRMDKLLCPAMGYGKTNKYSIELSKKISDLSND